MLLLLLQTNNPHINTTVDDASLYVGVFLIVIGVAIWAFKLYGLIAGYNTLTPQEKATVPIKKLARLMRNVLCSMGVVLISGYYLSQWLNNSMINQGCFYVGLVGGVLLLIIVSSSEVYK